MMPQLGASQHLHNGNNDFKYQPTTGDEFAVSFLTMIAVVEQLVGNAFLMVMSVRQGSIGRVWRSLVVLPSFN